jgi:hypothetical protein
VGNKRLLSLHLQFLLRHCGFHRVEPSELEREAHERDDALGFHFMGHVFLVGRYGTDGPGGEQCESCARLTQVASARRSAESEIEDAPSDFLSADPPARRGNIERVGFDFVSCFQADSE